MKRSLLPAAGLACAVCLASAATAQVVLPIKRLEGTSVSRGTFKVQQTLNIAGMNVETKVDVVSRTRYTVGKPGADGKTPVVSKGEGTTFKLSAPGVEVDFDSSKPDAAKSDLPQIQAIIDTLKVSAGATYTLVFGKDNKIVEVLGIDKLLETAPPAAVDTLREELKLERLKQENDQETARLPDGPVKMGDRWMRTEVMNLGAGQTLTFETYFEYLGTAEKNGRTLDKIGIFRSTVKYAIKPGGAIPLTVVNSELKVDSSTGAFLFDREAGAVVESTETVRVTGPMTFSINGMELPGSLDLTLETGSALVK